MALSLEQQQATVTIINHYADGDHPELRIEELKFIQLAFIKACVQAALDDPKLKASYRAYAEAIMEDLGDVKDETIDDQEDAEVEAYMGPLAPLEGWRYEAAEGQDDEEEWDEFCELEEYEGDDLGEFVCEKEYEPH